MNSKILTWITLALMLAVPAPGEAQQNPNDCRFTGSAANSSTPGVSFSGTPDIVMNGIADDDSVVFTHTFTPENDGSYDVWLDAKAELATIDRLYLSTQLNGHLWDRTANGPFDNTACRVFPGSLSFKNQAPEANAIATPSATTTSAGDDLVAEIFTRDPEGDSISSTNWRWYRSINNQMFPVGNYLGGSDYEYDNEYTLPASELADGDVIFLRITTDDEFGGSALQDIYIARVNDAASFPTAALTSPTPGASLPSQGTINYDAGSSTGTAPLEYRWDLNGDNFWDDDWSTTATATSAAPAAGTTHSILLETRDADGFVDRLAATFQANQPPTVTGISFDEPSPVTGDVVTATATATDPNGDSPTLSYLWTAPDTTTTATGATATLNQRGTWTLEATATDSLGDTSSSSTTLDVGNAAPTVAIALGPGGAETGDDIAASVSVVDPESDSVTCTAQWRVNGADVGAAQASCSPSVLAASNHQKGDTVLLSITATDSLGASGSGDGSLQIGDTAPDVSVTLPASPTSDSDIVATVTTSDVDSDTPITCTYIWTHTQEGGDPHTHSGDDCLPSMPAAHLSRDDTVVIEVTATADGASSTATSNLVTILNSNPTISALAISGGADTTEALDVTFGYVDVDPDTLTCTLYWIKDGQSDAGTAQACTDTPTNFQTASSATKRGETWTARLVVTDGVGGSAESQTSVVIGNAAPVVTKAFGAPVKESGIPELTLTLSDADFSQGDAAPACELVWKHTRGTTVTTLSPSVDCSDGGDYPYPNSDTLKGDIITADITATDGEESSVQTATTVSQTIANTAPELPTLETQPTNRPSSEGIVLDIAATDSDSDTLTCFYTWERLDGGSVVETVENNSPCTDDGVLPASNVKKGQEWRWNVKAYDGSDFSPELASSSNIVPINAPPAVSSITLNPTAPHRGDAITATIACGDSDGDDFSYVIEWTRPADSSGNGDGHHVEEDSGIACPLVSTLPASMVDVRRDWTLTVTLDDGDGDQSAPFVQAVVVSNQLPTADITITPALPKTGDSFQASFTWNDQDQDPVQATGEWIPPFTTTITGDTIQPSQTTRSQTWTYKVTLNDGIDTVTAQKSVVIQNTPPTATGVAITPETPGANEPLVASITGIADADQDSVTATFLWVKQDAATFTGANLPAYLTTVGDVWTVQATPTDGADSGTPVSGSVTILAADTDGDGLRDDVDNCIGVANPGQENHDSDANGDACDSDDDDDGFSDLAEIGAESDPLNAASVPDDKDGDTIANNVDNCPLKANALQRDLDADGIGDVCDPDRDGDGYDNAVDGLPDDARYHLDADGDGVADEEDQCPGFDDKKDTDNDGTADGCDLDIDGDGVPNNQDVFPEDPAESKDFDRDGIGNNADNCIDHANKDQVDTDGDGKGDACDLDNSTPLPVDPATPPVFERPNKVRTSLSGGRAHVYFESPPVFLSTHYLIWRYSTPENIGVVEAVPGKTSYSFDAGLVPDGEHHYGVIGIDSLEKKDAAIALITSKDQTANGPAVTKSGYVICPKGAVDQDRDGLCDAVEIEMGLDPFDADSDKDGRLDGEEMLDLDGQGVGDAGDASDAPAPQTTSAASGLPAWLWLALGGVIVVAAGIVTAVIFILKRKDATTGARGGSEPTPSWAT